MSPPRIPARPDGKWRVIIMEDQRAVARSLRDLLVNSQEFECLGVFLRLETGLRKAAELRPDVILFDLVYRQKECPEAIADLRRAVPQARILALTAYDDADLVFRSLRAGADGYLLKTDQQAPLISRLVEMLEHGPVFSRAVLRRLLQHFRRQGERIRQAPLAVLSAEELKTLELVYEGHSNNSIATRLKISTENVKKRVQNILQKLRVENRTRAAWIYGQSVPKSSLGAK